jgi:hypothetical protein
MRAIHLRDCTTGREVIGNFEAVGARLNALWPSIVSPRPASPRWKHTSAARRDLGQSKGESE